MFGIELWIVIWHWESQWRWGVRAQHQNQVYVQFSCLLPEMLRFDKK